MKRPYYNRGFTLIELMISVAIALLLIIGVNTVFKATAMTIGAGNSALSSARDSRTVMSTLLADMNGVVPTGTGSKLGGGSAAVANPGPCFIIHSEHQYAYRNAGDLLSAADPTAPDPTQPRPWIDQTVFANTTYFPGNMAPVPLIHFRSHRIDKLGFFTRGVISRQTSSDANSIMSPTTSNEAWVVYGHAMQPSNYLISNPSVDMSAAPASHYWYGPGEYPPSPASVPATKNDNNLTSCDWMLARQAILLVPKPNLVTDPNYLKDADTGDGAYSGLTPLSGPLPPYQASTSALITKSLNDPNLTIDRCRLDIANTSIAAFGSAQRKNGLANLYTPAWTANAAIPGAWWEQMLGYRLQVSPYLLPDPNTAASTSIPKISPWGLAKASPNLIRGCSQFIVEYAGNYYTKNEDGSAVDTLDPDPLAKDPVTNTTPYHRPIPDPSGALDFYRYKSVAGPTLPTSVWYRATRWYGFPRLVNQSVGSTPLINPSNGDVVPLRDVLASLGPTATAPPLWLPDYTSYPIKRNFADAERFNPDPVTSPGLWPLGTISKTSWPPNYYSTAKMVPGTEADPAKRYAYTAAWGPDTTMPFPKLIRITIALDDHEGRLSQPQTYEFIYRVAE